MAHNFFTFKRCCLFGHFYLMPFAERSLSEQYEVVDRERKHLEDRGVHCMNSLYMNQVDQPQPGNAYEVPNLANAVVLPLPVPRQHESVACQHSTPDQVFFAKLTVSLSSN